MRKHYKQRSNTFFKHFCLCTILHNSLTPKSHCQNASLSLSRLPALPSESWLHCSPESRLPAEDTLCWPPCPGPGKEPASISWASGSGPPRTLPACRQVNGTNWIFPFLFGLYWIRLVPLRSHLSFARETLPTMTATQSYNRTKKHSDKTLAHRQSGLSWFYHSFKAVQWYNILKFMFNL